MFSERASDVLPRTVDTLDTIVESGRNIVSYFVSREFIERQFRELSMLSPHSIESVEDF